MYNTILNLLAKEKYSFSLWYPFFIAFGAIFYFNLSKETDNSVIILLFVLLALLLIIYIKYNKALILIIALVAFGFLTAQIKTNLFKTKPPKKARFIKYVLGAVDNVSNTARGQKILVTTRMGKIKFTTKTKRIIHVADKIRFSAYVKPPPPITPTGYNFAFFEYFDGISGVGFSTSEIEIIKDNNNTDAVSRSKLAISGIRDAIYNNFKANIKKDTAEIASALVMGKKDGISKKIMEYFRKSGTAHLLAISGMHLSVVSMLFLKLFRSLFSLSEFIALRFNIKKIASLFSILFGFFYLNIAGCPVSAKRAFLMTSTTMLAYLFDKKVNTVRALSFAAIIMIIIVRHKMF